MILFVILLMHCQISFNDADKTIKFDDACYQDIKSSYEQVNVKIDVEKEQTKFGGLK